jgi:hypothetical protein
MNTPISPRTEAGGSPIEELTRRRTLLQQWLARLDEVSSEAPGHVTERVRADYQARLREVTEQLGAHRESLAEELGARRGELERAEAHLSQARDALEEALLRHRIGEVEDEEWGTRRPELAGAVSAAEEEVERAREEVERLDSLLSEMAGAPAAAYSGDDTLPEYPPAAPAAEESAEEAVDLAWLEEIETGPALSGARPAPDEETTADDLAFLEELDRAIAGSTTPPPRAAEDPDRTLDADRAGMLLCKECGAINEPGGWYCEVCGSEL